MKKFSVLLVALALLGLAGESRACGHVAVANVVATPFVVPTFAAVVPTVVSNVAVVPAVVPVVPVVATAAIVTNVVAVQKVKVRGGRTKVKVKVR